MNIQLLHTQVDKLKLNSFEIQEEKKENSFDMDFDIIYAKDKDVFSIVFKIEIMNYEEFELSFNYEAIFKTDSEITDDFTKSSFPSVNAPAIAFPFVRAFVSSLTLNSGYKPVILPSINFTSL